MQAIGIERQKMLAGEPYDPLDPDAGFSGTSSAPVATANVQLT
jgi:hypothetical protein